MDYINNQYDYYLIEQINYSIDTGNIEYIKMALKLNYNYTAEIKKIANNIILELLTENIDSLYINK
tara:strand:- start:2917 stop:3114 length:198 start_codon:yes stop_codon:yes gene_type:complete